MRVRLNPTAFSPILWPSVSDPRSALPSFTCRLVNDCPDFTVKQQQHRGNKTPTVPLEATTTGNNVEHNPAAAAKGELGAGASKEVSSSSSPRGDEGNTVESAVVIEEEDWGLYIRAEEDYQRTKTVWLNEHKEWIEDQVSYFIITIFSRPLFYMVCASCFVVVLKLLVVVRFLF